MSLPRIPLHMYGHIIDGYGARGRQRKLSWSLNSSHYVFKNVYLTVHICNLLQNELNKYFCLVFVKKPEPVIPYFRQTPMGLLGARNHMQFAHRNAFVKPALIYVHTAAAHTGLEPGTFLFETDYQYVTLI